MNARRSQPARTDLQPAVSLHHDDPSRGASGLSLLTFLLEALSANPITLPIYAFKQAVCPARVLNASYNTSPGLKPSQVSSRLSLSDAMFAHHTPIPGLGAMYGPDALARRNAFGCAGPPASGAIVVEPRTVNGRR